jgi:flagellar motor switch protein FliG
MAMASLSGEEKAALLLLSLDQQLAQKVLAQLGPDRKARLSGHMARLSSSPHFQDNLAQVLNEAEELIHKPSLRLVGSPEAPVKQSRPAPEVPQPMRLEPKSVGTRVDMVTAEPQPVLKMAPMRIEAIDRPAPPAAAESDGAGGGPAGPESDPIAALNALPTDTLAAALNGESARTIGIVLSQLSVESAGAIFRQFGSELRKDVSVQIGTSAPPGPEVLNRIARAILIKSRTVKATGANNPVNSRFKKMAELLRTLDRQERVDALGALQARDAVAASQVSELLYQWEDMLILDQRSVQKVLSEVDSKTLATALRHAADEIKNKILDNMSKRAREGLIEEMEFMTAVTPTQSRQGQKAIVEIIQKLDNAGEIVMIR